MSAIKHIEIPNPCQQKWQEMTPNIEGRHCQSCKKTVVDFTQMTAGEIVAHLALNRHTCGRFEPHQLDLINQQLVSFNKFSITNWQKWAIAVWLLSAISYFKADAQTKPQTLQTTDSVKQDKLSQVIDSAAWADSVKTINGIVVDGKKESIPGVNIHIAGVSHNTITALDGSFKMTLPKGVKSITFIAIGFESKTVNVQPGDKNLGNVVLNSMPAVLGEVMVNNGFDNLLPKAKGFKF